VILDGNDLCLMYPVYIEIKSLSAEKDMIMSTLIYIVDDEPDILELVDLNLSKQGFLTEVFDRAEPMLKALQQKKPDLLVLDLMLPDADGMDICKHLKEQEAYQTLPILMLTARVEVDDRVQGLEYGADDYVTKPFAPRELVARIQALLRRSEWQTDKHVLFIDRGLRIDINRFEVFVLDKKADLTLTEFKLLQLLTKRPGWVYNRQQLLDYLWGNDKIVIDRTIDVHIKNLREKIAPFGMYIKNVRGIGYKFDL